MNVPLNEYIARVEAFEIDSDSKTLRFVDRLARENRWTAAYARRVIGEYLRFCILATRSGHPVTPSEDVDQAWHLHLTYTRSYWERFCGETLGVPLHHEPTAGGPGEGDKFRHWYHATLDSYRELFGSEPPEDIWPPVDQRFAHAGEYKWMNAGREWAVPKRLVVVCAGAILTTAVVSIGLVIEDGQGARPVTAAILPFALDGPSFLVFYAALALLGLLAVLVLRITASAAESRDTRIDDVDELTTDELATLSGGGSRLAHVSLTRLFAEGRIEATKTLWWYSKFTAIGPAPESPAIDRDLFDAIQSGKSTNRLMEVVKPHFERAESVLVENGLRYPSAQKSKAATCLVVFIGAIAVLRIVQGVVLGEEVGFLLIMAVLFVITALAMNLRWSRTTPKGTAYLENVKSEIDTDSHSGSDPEPAALALSVAVLGTSAVEDIEGFAPLATLSSSIGRASSGSGCGAGCSGCGGGGCGGCGGCGG